MRKITEDLQQNIFETGYDTNEFLVLEGIRRSFSYAKVISKQIYPDTTYYFENLLNSIKDIDLVITNEMFSEGYRFFNIMKNNQESIKQFFRYYFHILQLILIFNRVNDECCDVCQGELFYYYEKKNSRIIKICGTCSSVFDTGGKRIESAALEYEFASKEKLTPFLVSEFHNE